jgi:hypothetical protein
MERRSGRQPTGPPRRPAQSTRNDKPRLPKRKPATNLFFAAIFVLVGIYVVGYIYNHVLRDNVDSVRIEAAYMDVAATFAGVIIRDEAVYHATLSGEIIFHVEQHSRVRRNTVVAGIRDWVATDQTDGSEQASGQQAALNSQFGGQMLNDVEISQANNQILAMIESAGFAANVEISDLQELGARVSREIAGRNQLYFAGNSGLADAQIESHAATATQAAASNISAQTQGIVSFYMDGLEAVLTPNNLTNIPIATTRAQSQNFTAERQISQGQGVFRIVRSNDWFIAAHIPRHYAQNWTTNSQITIFVNQPDGILPLNVNPYRLIEQGNYFYTVFITNFETLRFIDQRDISFQLRQNPAQGLQIPRTAIVQLSIFPIERDFVRDDYEMMVVTRNDGRILAVAGWISNDGAYFYALADGSNLRVGDVLIHEELGDFTIELIEVVHGVFVTNRGHTLFRQIHLPQNFNQNVTQNSYNNFNAADYIVLDAAENPHIRLFDWIIRDAGDVDNRLILN